MSGEQIYSAAAKRIVEIQRQRDQVPRKETSMTLSDPFEKAKRA